MVMHQIKPMQNETIAISHPHNIIQRILTRKCPTLLLYSTQRPNGYKTNPANFKHCIPSGMPIKVIKQSNAAINHSSEIIPPPNRNHIMLPKVFILLPQTQYICDLIYHQKPHLSCLSYWPYWKHTFFKHYRKHKDYSKDYGINGETG